MTRGEPVTVHTMPDSSPTVDLVVVANRLPVRRMEDGGGSAWTLSSGGLVTALVPVLRESSGVTIRCPSSPRDVRLRPSNRAFRPVDEGGSSGPRIWSLQSACTDDSSWSADTNLDARGPACDRVTDRWWQTGSTHDRFVVVVDHFCRVERPSRVIEFGPEETATKRRAECPSGRQEVIEGTHARLFERASDSHGHRARHISRWKASPGV